MYCDRCSGFCELLSREIGSNGFSDGKLVWKSVGILLHQNIRDLKSASDSGCSICRNIWCSWTEKEQREIGQASSVHLNIVVDQGVPSLKASASDPGGSDTLKARTIGMYLGQTSSGR